MTLVKTQHPFAKSFDGLMNEIFNELPTSFGKAIREDVLHFPPVNIVEKTSSYHIQLNAPGFDKADFSVKLDANGGPYRYFTSKSIAITENAEYTLNFNTRLLQNLNSTNYISAYISGSKQVTFGGTTTKVGASQEIIKIY